MATRWPLSLESAAPVLTVSGPAGVCMRTRFMRSKGALSSAGFAAFLFLFPGLFFYVCFEIVPLVGTTVLSFTNWNGFDFRQIKLSGFGNFSEITKDHVFWLSLLHNVIFTAGSLTLRLGVALMLALILDQSFPAANFIRGVYLLPTVLSLVTIGVTFKLALSPTLGFIVPFFKAIGLKALAIDNLGNSKTVMQTLVLIDTWCGVGLFMFLFTSKLMTINQDLHEAAKVSGANVFQDIWYVTLPLLKATTAMIMLIGVIESFKIFPTVYIMTNGGPWHSSEVLSSWAYFQAFTANRVGYGSSILFVQLIITVIFAFIQTKYQPREIE